MSNLESLTHSNPWKIDPRLQRSKDLCLPLQLLLLPVILPLVPFILVFLVWVELRRTQGELDLFKFDREPGLPPETSQESRSAAAAADQASSQADSPPRRTCTCHHQGPNGPPSKRAAGLLSSSPRSSSTSSGSVDSVAAPNSADTSPLGGSEAYDSPSAPEEAVPAPANTMQHNTGAGSPIARSGKDLLPTGAVSAQARAAASGATFLALTTENASPDDASALCNDEDDSETTRMIRRRTVRMREEGVRVRVGYLQLTDPIPTRVSARGDAGVADSSSPSSPGPLTPPTPSSGSGSPPSGTLLLLPGTALPAPALSVSTPRSPSPQKQVQGTSSVLPTSGADAGPALVRIEEKLLAVPADAVSRRLLIDGRAILKRKIRTPRSASSLNGGGSSQGHTSAEGGKPSSGYASDLME